MVENGLLEEVQNLQPFKQLQSLNTVGYKELFNYLDDKISFEEAIRLIKRNTRRYAKRQLTWFRGVENAKWIQPPFDLEKFIPDNT
jgi:tRNA dimethylallyltransferase